MPVIDGIDIPVPEWCTALDAGLWIMLRRPPVALDHVGLRRGDAPAGFKDDDKGQPLRSNPDYLRSWHILYEAASQGKVGLRGRPAIGLQKLVLDPIINRLCCKRWGEFETIIPDKLKAAGVHAFLDIERFRCLTDGMVYTTEDFPTTAWAYTDIEVNVSDLLRRFHSAEGEALRVGTDVIFTDREAPQAKSLAEAVVTRDVGGRPPTWDWYGAINATWAALEAGTLIPKGRSDLNHHMTEWLARKHEGRSPDDTQIRAKVRQMWRAREAAATEARKAAERETLEAAARKTREAAARKTP